MHFRLSSDMANWFEAVDKADEAEKDKTTNALDRWKRKRSIKGDPLIKGLLREVRIIKFSKYQL